MAKTTNNVAGEAAAPPKKKELRRLLEKAKVSQQRAERKAGELRVRLERAESRLAKKAEKLVAVQALGEKLRKPAEGKKARSQASHVENGTTSPETAKAAVAEASSRSKKRAASAKAAGVSKGTSKSDGANPAN